MTPVSLDKSEPAVWIALKRLDQPAGVMVLREVSFPSAAQVTTVTQILTDTFGLNSPGVVLKIRTHRGHLIPLNSSMPANSKHTPHVLEVTRFSQHVRPKPRTVPVTVINKSMKTRLQAIDRRIQRLNDLLPQIKLRHDEKLTQEVERLNLKLMFLCRKMQVADAHSWKGVLTRTPLW